jgi:hypothetical protein
MYIYGYKNIINSKWYIGKSETKNKKRRHSEHVKHVKNNVKTQFYDAVRKYRWDNFERHILIECNTREILNQKEKEFIMFYNSYKKGYNATLGGDGGDTFSKLTNEQKFYANTKRSESLKISWQRDRESRLQSFATGDYSSRKSEEYRKLQSERCKQIFTVLDPNGNVHKFKGLEEMKQYFAKLNEGKSLSSPHRISPTNIAWKGFSKNWKLIK